MMTTTSTGPVPFRASIPQNVLIGALRVSQSTTMAVLEMYEEDEKSRFPRHVVRLIPDPENANNPNMRQRLFCVVPTDRPFYLGLGLMNHSSRYKAYPTFVGGANVYEGCNTDPSACTSSEMWELYGRQTMIISHLLNPHSKQGRRLVVTPRGEGYGIGEATFNTTEFAGQISMFERDSEGSHHSGSDYHDRGDISARGVPMGGGTPKGFVSRGGDYDGTRSADLGATRGPSRSRSAEPEVNVDIGAGAEQNVNHHNTGVTYSPTLIVFPLIQLIGEDEAGPLLNAIARGHRVERYGEISRSGDWWNVPNFAITGAHIPMAPLPGRHHPHRS